MFCYYCVQLVFAGKGINYTYTQTVGGTTNGVLNTLNTLGIALNIVNGVITLITSFSFTDANTAQAVGVVAEMQVAGTLCCRYHAKNLTSIP